MKFLCIAYLSLISVASASWSKNLNYRSPSEHHPDLGVSIHRIVKRNDPSCTYDPSSLNFTHGVASGDPYPNSVILWTRVAPQSDNSLSNVTVSGIAPLFDPDNDKYVRVSKSPICVQYQVSTDPNLANVVDSGTVYTSSDVDFTLKVEANNLQPFSTYYYKFNVCNSNNTSPIGRTKTTPHTDDDVSNVNLAVYSCANFPFGFFNAYGNPVRKDSVDYVIFLGDYIYEYQNGFYGNGTAIGRVSQPDRTLYTLYDYRRRIADYRTDMDLVANHQQFPWIPVWDDHEVGDNTYRDGSSFLSNTEASFVSDGGVAVDQRKMNAVRAYYEWMPIRQVDMDDNLRIWRTFSIGTLIDLIMLDTRHYDRSITDLYTNTDYVQQISNDGGRSMMGARQEHWFYRSLSESADRGATWRIVGSQTVFSRINQSAIGDDAHPFDVDAWDGYLSNKNRTLNHLYQNNINNNIFLSGDSHASWVTDLVWLDEENYDPATGAGSIGVEFAGSAVSSPSPMGETTSLAASNNASNLLQKENQELHWQDVYYRGYYELQVSVDQVEARYFGMPSILTRNSWEIPLANFTVVSGENKLQRPVGGGIVHSGSLKYGQMIENNGTYDTESKTWFVSNGDQKV